MPVNYDAATPKDKNEREGKYDDATHY